MLDKLKDVSNKVVKYLLDNKKKTLTVLLVGGVMYYYPEKLTELLSFLLNLI